MREADAVAFGEMCELFGDELSRLAKASGSWEELGRSLGAEIERAQRLDAEYRRRLADRRASKAGGVRT